MKVLSREELLERGKKLRKELVELPELGGAVYVRELAGWERDAYEASLMQQVGNTYVMKLKNARARLAALSICDENGNRLFSERDVQELGKISAAALDRIFDAASKLSRIGEEEIKEVVKNSAGAQSDDSSSD